MRTALRSGLVVLFVVELLLGVWTLLFPASFYVDVPTVDLSPPFSEHPFRDFGGTTLGLALVLGAAAVWLERRLVVVALLAYLAFSAPHLLFHLGHLSGASEREGLALVAALAASVVLPVLLLAGVLRTRRSPGGAVPSSAGGSPG